MKWISHLLHLASLSRALGYNVQTHDASFTPDIILRTSLENTELHCRTRLTAVVNGTVPGPELRIPEGKTTWIRVYNDMTDQNTTIHWHGLTQSVAPFADGSPLASQWPIAPLHYFDYEIHPEPGSAGTYFYHSHVGFQAVSAAGALIVEDPETPPYDYDEEKVIFLQDFWNKTDQNITVGLAQNPLGWIGDVDGLLVNGYGRPNTSTSTSESCTIAPISVDPGKTYRLRFIGSSGMTFFSLAIEGHDEMTIIEADAVYSKPINISYLQIASGQRYSILLRTKTEEELKAESKDLYYMQLKTLERPVTYTGFAAFTYSKQPSLPIEPPAVSEWPLDLPDTTYGFLDYELTPYKVTQKVPSRGQVDRTIVLKVYQTNPFSVQNSFNQTFWTVNNYTPWFEHTVQKPYLLAMYENDNGDLPNYSIAVQQGGFDAKAKAFPLKIGEVVDIILQNIGMGPLTSNGSNAMDAHPFHFHISHYWDMGSGNGTYDPVAHDARLEEAYATGWSPPLRDTSQLFRQPDTHQPIGVDTNWRAWRVNVTTPGGWMMHCHTLVHMVMGMQSVWVVGDKDDLTPIPQQLASEFYTYGGAAYGNTTHAPRMVHFFDEK